MNLNLNYVNNSPLQANNEFETYKDQFLDELDELPPDLLDLIQPSHEGHQQIQSHMTTPNSPVSRTPLVSTNFSNQNTPIIPMGTFTNSSPITPLQPHPPLPLDLDRIDPRYSRPAPLGQKYTPPPSSTSSNFNSDHVSQSPIGLGLGTLSSYSETNLHSTKDLKQKHYQDDRVYDFNSPDSPTTIDCTSPKSDLDSTSMKSQRSNKKEQTNVTAEDILNSDPFESRGVKKEPDSDLINEFLDLDKDDEIATLLKSYEPPPPKQSSSSLINPKKKRNSVPKFTTNKTNSSKILKKSSSFNGSSTFIVNPKLQWSKNNTTNNNINQGANSKRSVSSSYSLADLNHNGQPIFTLSNHYSFVYENNEGQEYVKQQQQQHQNRKFYKESLKNLESGLIEFQLDLKKKK